MYSMLKRNGWNAISSKYWIAFVVELIVVAISGAISGVITPLINTLTSIFSNFVLTGVSLFSNERNYGFGMLMAFGVFILVMSLSIAVSFAISAFVTVPLNIGKNKYYLNNRQNTEQIQDVFVTFTSNYMNCVKVGLFKTLYIFLWSLLFIIPGIIKQYEYFTVEYILAENQNIDYKAALDISTRMMNGKKMDAVVLSLSFIGWYLLGLLCCGVGTYFVTPYYSATLTEFYEFVKADAIREGRISASEITSVQSADI